MSNKEDIDLNGKVALVAVEEVDACNYMEEIVAESGMTVLKAHDGQVALEMIKSEKPVVAILDVGLPSLFGFDICGVVKQDAELADIKIILMASVYDSAAYKRGPSSLYGADDYIERHHVKDDLVDKIKSVLAGAHYTNEKVEEESFVPFGGDSGEDSSEAPPVTLDSSGGGGGLPPLAASGLDEGSEDLSVEAETVTTTESDLGVSDSSLSGGDFSEEGETVTTTESGLDIGNSSMAGGDLSEEGETATTTESSLGIGGVGGEMDSEVGGSAIPPLGSTPVSDVAPEPVPEARPVPDEETPVPEAAPVPDVTPVPVPEATPEPAPVPEATPEPAPVPEAAPEPAPVPEATPEPAPVPEAAVTAAKKEAYKIDEAKLGINAKKILASDEHAEEKAKKLARVVVSDIFLYNSEHVDVGIREGTFYKLIKEDLRDGIKYMKRKIPKHLPSDKILKEAFDEYILKRKETMDKE